MGIVAKSDAKIALRCEPGIDESLFHVLTPPLTPRRRVNPSMTHFSLSRAADSATGVVVAFLRARIINLRFSGVGAGEERGLRDGWGRRLQIQTRTPRSSSNPARATRRSRPPSAGWRTSTTPTRRRAVRERPRRGSPSTASPPRVTGFWATETRRGDGATRTRPAWAPRLATWATSGARARSATPRSRRSSRCPSASSASSATGPFRPSSRGSSRVPAWGATRTGTWDG